MFSFRLRADAANPVPGGGRGGLAPAVPDNPAAVVPEGGLGGWGCLPALPLACFFSPIPPAPLPGGKGGIFLFSYARGFAPCIPEAEPAQHLQTLPLWYLKGGLPRRHWLSLPLACFFPHPPAPLPLRGRGRILLYFAGGYRPRHPCIKPLAALTAPAKQAPCTRSLRFAAKTTGSGSLWAVPVAKERGDRGRGTSAFEMVLSPGAGRAGAAGNARAQAANHHGFITKCSKAPAPQIPVAGRINKLCR